MEEKKDILILEEKEKNLSNIGDVNTDNLDFPELDDAEHELGDAIPGYEDVSFYETEEDFIKGRKNYRYFLSQFEGPMDLILYQVKIHKIAIEELFLSDITKQYLEIVSHIDKFDEAEITYAGEFIVMASTLLYIKSVKILPTEQDIDPDAENPERDFIDRLKEYEMFKQMALRIKDLETTNRFYREPVYTEEDYRLTIKNFSLDKLLDAYAYLIEKINRQEEEIEPKKVIKERYSLANRIGYISFRVFKEKSVSFFSLFEEDFSRLEIINTFLAMLELLKRQQIKVEQPEAFGDINITIGDNVEAPIEITQEDTEIGEY